MAIGAKSFRRILRSHKVPFFAFPKFAPKYLPDNFLFSSVTIEREVVTGSEREKKVVRIPADLQQEIYRSLCFKIKDVLPHIVGISSAPNDYMALQAASLIHYSLLNRIMGIDIKWVNMAIPEVARSYLTVPHVLIVHNIVPDHQRAMKVRDIISLFPYSLKLVVIGGTNAVDYFDNYLRSPISGMMHFTGIKGNRAIGVGRETGGNDDYTSPVFTHDIERLIKPMVDKITRNKKR
jgi:hypothetical protein